LHKKARKTSPKRLKCFFFFVLSDNYEQLAVPRPIASHPAAAHCVNTPNTHFIQFVVYSPSARVFMNEIQQQRRRGAFAAAGLCLFIVNLFFFLLPRHRFSFFFRSASCFDIIVNKLRLWARN